MFISKPLRGLFAFATVCAILLAPAFAQQPSHPYGASQPIPDRYIIVLKSHVTNPVAVAALARGAGAQVHHIYSSALKGFSASMPVQALQGLQNNPNVEFIEQDQTVSLNDVQTQATW